MDLIQFALEPRDRKRSPKSCEDTAACNDVVPHGFPVILAAVLLLVPLLVGILAAHRSDDAPGVVNGEPFSQAEEDERIPRGWQ